MPAELICLPPSARGSDSNPSDMSHFPVLFPHHPCLLSGHLHLVPSATFAADSETQPFFLGTLAGWVWWLLAVVHTRCINRVKRHHIFSYSLCSVAPGSATYEKEIQSLEWIVLFFGSSFFTFFLSHSGLCIPLFHSSCINSTEHWWGLNLFKTPERAFKVISEPLDQLELE